MHTLKEAHLGWLQGMRQGNHVHLSQVYGLWRGKAMLPTPQCITLAHFKGRCKIRLHHTILLDSGPITDTYATLETVTGATSGAPDNLRSTTVSVGFTPCSHFWGLD